MTGELSTTPDEPVRAAGYVRVSTDRQAEQGYSLEEQEVRIRATAEAQGWQLVEVYVDQASGAKESRPGLDRMLAERGRFDRLIVWKLDRLGRSGLHTLELFRTLEKAGVGLVSLTEAFDTATPVGRLVRDILTAVAAMEREAIRERTRMGAAARARKGQAHGGPPPYGYRWAPNKGGLRLEPAEEEVVKRIYREYLSGIRQQAIAKRLNAERVPTRHGQADWHQATVRGILERPAYRGAIRVRGEDGTVTEVDGNHPPIISPELWAEVAALREAQSRAPGKGRGRPADGFLLSRGLLRCACGGAMVPRTATNRRKGPYEAYYCYGRKLRPESCDMPPLPRRLVDDAVTDYFVSAVLDVEETRRRAAAVADHALREVTALREQADREFIRAQKRLDRVRADYQDGQLPVADWNQQRDQLQAELEAAEAEAERLRDRERAVHDLPDLPDALEDLHRRLLAPVRDAGTIASLRAGLARVFERFEVLRVPLDGASDAELRGDLPTREDAVIQHPEDAPDALLPRLKVREDRRVIADRPWRDQPPAGEPEELTRDSFQAARPSTAAERRAIVGRDRERPAEVLALIPFPRPEVIIGNGSPGRLTILAAALDQASGDDGDESGNGLPM